MLRLCCRNHCMRYSCTRVSCMHPKTRWQRGGSRGSAKMLLPTSGTAGRAVPRLVGSSPSSAAPGHRGEGGGGGSAAAAGLKRLGGTAEASFAGRLCRFKAVPPFRARSGTGKRNWVFALPGRGERSAVPRPAAPGRPRPAALRSVLAAREGWGGEELGRGRASAPHCLPPASPLRLLCIPSASLLHPFCFPISAPLHRIATPVLFPTAAARGLPCKSCLLAECVLE